MGYTGTSHRIALFDDKNILANRVPVKDVPTLSDDLEFLNCTVKNGVPRHHLQGEKTLCLLGISRSRTTSKSWANSAPEYSLLQGFSSYRDWNGLCDENTCYAIGLVTIPKTSTRHTSISSVLCMTATGVLFFACYSDMTTLIKGGVTFVQVGTPKLFYPNSYHKGKPCEGRIASVGIQAKDVDKALWYRRTVKENIDDKVEAVWRLETVERRTVLDLRNYKSARVFGLASIGDAGVIIYPEKTETVWFPLLYSCMSLKAVYLPESVTTVMDYGVTPRNVKRVKFYSNSQAVKDFCTKHKATYIPCASAEEFLEEFYATKQSDYIGTADASNIAVLAGARSELDGESGTIWSAALFSCKEKGIATDILHEKYPVVATCDYPLPEADKIKVSAEGNSIMHGETARERTRTLAAAFTQFYPLFTKDSYVDKDDEIYIKYSLGDYNLYLAKNVLNVKQFYGTTDKEAGDYELNHIALLEDVSKKRIIHRFVCGNLIHNVMRNMEGSCAANRMSSAVLRYADKLPALNMWVSEDAREEKEVVQELFTSFLTFSYGSAKSNRQLAGIDLHTGYLTTMVVTLVANKYSRKQGNRRLTHKFNVEHR